MDMELGLVTTTTLSGTIIVEHGEEYNVTVTPVVFDSLALISFVVTANRRLRQNLGSGIWPPFFFDVRCDESTATLIRRYSRFYDRHPESYVLSRR